MNSIVLSNDVEIDPVCREDEFLGLGTIRVGGIPIRSGQRPMFVDIRNPYGVHLRDYRLARREEHDDGTLRLSFTMQREETGAMDWQLHECRPVRITTDWSTPPRDAAGTELTLELRPASRRIGAAEFRGFSYRYHYRSADIPIYMILDRGTWEPGGSARGNAFWMRSCFAPCRYVAASEHEHYSTEWFHPDCVNANIFQFLPLQTELQGFSFTASQAGVLVTWPTAVSHVRSLFEKPRGTNLLVHLHEHCGDLATEFHTAPVEVLFCPGARDDTALANLWGSMFDLVAEALHTQLGLRRERVTPYGQIEEWTDADLDLYRREGLPLLAQAGVRYVEIANHFQNNMNTYGISNMCCTVDYRVADTVGEDRLQAFCTAAKAADIRVGMWGNTSISAFGVQAQEPHGAPKRLTPPEATGVVQQVIKRAAEPFVLNTFGAVESDHYTPRFMVLNLRDPTVRDYWLRSWRDACERIGLGGIFLDSSFNLSSDKFHYRFNAAAGKGGVTSDQTGELGGMRPAALPPAAIQSQYHAHLTLMKEMQDIGYIYANEDSGVFGIHRHGPGLERRLNSLFMWADHLCGFDAAALDQQGDDPDDVFFRGLAYRMMWALIWHVPSRKLSWRYYGPRDERDLPTASQLRLLRAFDKVSPLMTHREIVSLDKGVLYRHGEDAVLWAFSEFDLEWPSAGPIESVLTGEVTRGPVLHARRHAIYRSGVHAPP